jgi:hypothetical protein
MNLRLLGIGSSERHEGLERNSAAVTASNPDPKTGHS